MRIKCCGITRPEDARYAEACGADAIGVVVFSPTSKRSVTPERAREIFDAVGPFTTTVAVSHTTSHEDLEQILALHPDAIQISHPFVFREKPAAKVIRVIGRNDPLPTDCDAIIVDESHGSGKNFDLSHARDVVQQIGITGHPCRGTHPGKCGGCHPAGAPVCRGCCKRYRDGTGNQRPYRKLPHSLRQHGRA